MGRRRTGKAGTEKTSSKGGRAKFGRHAKDKKWVPIQVEVQKEELGELKNSYVEGIFLLETGEKRRRGTLLKVERKKRKIKEVQKREAQCETENRNCMQICAKVTGIFFSNFYL